MKYLFIFVFALLGSIAMAQTAYNWINFPTINGISHIKEARVRDYRLLEGKVKEVRTTSFFIGDDEKDKIEVSYSKSGNILSYQKTHLDPESKGGVSTFVLMQFAYNAAGVASSESVLTIIEGDTMEQIKDRWPEWFPLTPAPLKTNAAGYPTHSKLFQDTTYSFYDEFNRKLMDSIPSAQSGKAQKITYRYGGNKVYRNFYFLEDGEELYQREEYTLDDKGNWIEKKYFGAFNLESDECTELTTREIIYY